MKGTFDEPLRSRQAGGSKTPQRPRDDPKRAPREMPPPSPPPARLVRPIANNTAAQAPCRDSTPQRHAPRGAVGTRQSRKMPLS